MPINIENLKQFLGSDEQFIATLMEKFVGEIPKDGERMKKFAQEKDWKSVRAVSHKMLSSTKIFALDELTSVLQKIEKNSETQTHLEQIPSLISNFETAFETAVKDMKEQIGKLGKEHHF